MRSFYHEEHAAKPQRPRGRWIARLTRWVTILFALGCVLVDARLVHMSSVSGDSITILIRTVLLELEVYLALVVVLTTLRVIPYRTGR